MQKFENLLLQYGENKKIINKSVQVRLYKYITELPVTSEPSHNHHKNLAEEILPVFL